MGTNFYIRDAEKTHIGKRIGIGRGGTDFHFTTDTIMEEVKKASLYLYSPVEDEYGTRFTYGEFINLVAHCRTTSVSDTKGEWF